MMIRSFLYGSALLVIAGACRDDRTARIDEAAEAVLERRDDLADQRQDLARAEPRSEAIEQRAEIAHTAAELARAETDFDRRRQQLVDELRFRHRIYTVQTSVARGMLADPQLALRDRDTATDKVLTLERELGQTQQAIDAVATSTAVEWDAVQRTSATSFQLLSGAHDEAFTALAADRREPPGDADRGTTTTRTRGASSEGDPDRGVGQDDRAY
jgi:hypothetical protein